MKTIETANKFNGGDEMKNFVKLNLGFVLAVALACLMAALLGCGEEESTSKPSECMTDYNCFEEYGSGGLVCVDGKCKTEAGEDANWTPGSGGSGSGSGDEPKGIPSTGGNTGSGSGSDNPPANNECKSGETRYCGLSQDKNTGACHPGEQKCEDGKWGKCKGVQGPTAEKCNDVDDDCDGNTDEIFNKSGDVNNCGKCGNVCVALNTIPSCVNGACQYECLPSFEDLVGDEGCEYQCLPTFEGVEKCDYLDNDCDSKTDEGFNVLEDVDNCGVCGNVCSASNGVPACVYGTCGIKQCDPGFVDTNKDSTDGCECEYIGPEICDGFLDENCNGFVDENCKCVEGAFCGSQVGECQMGIATCDAEGNMTCVGQVKATAEKCNYLDDDCDGEADETFDLLTDAKNCGYCGLACQASNANVACVDGECVITSCLPGWYNLKGEYEDGCTYPCWLGVAEVCNDIDDNCNGEEDEGFDVLTDPLNCGQCGNVCDLWNATAACVDGICAVEQCDDGFWDIDEKPVNGCEYECIFVGPEVCDQAKVDEDCDFSKNEDCDCANDTTMELGDADGVCVQCVQTCVNGKWSECMNGTEPVPELCNMQDDDCDGEVDEDFNTQTDPDNCGWCNNKCFFADAEAICVNGLCQMGACSDMVHHDVDGETSSGCEYLCVSLGVELCNGVDDDCDGDKDEDFSLFTDPLNCGKCGHVCDLDNVSVQTCFFATCLVGDCEEGFLNLDKSPVNGCEYKCTPTGAEVCDQAGVDEDCNGIANEDCPCENGDENYLGTDEGECSKCTQTCVDGAWSDCVGGQEPTEELCNMKDDDCDAIVDEDFNTMTDPENCGWCGHACAYAHATPGCIDGFCVMGSCDNFYYDFNQDDSDGCESVCTVLGVELCNGVDDNCNGQPDEGFDLMSDVDNCGACGYVCNLDGVSTHECVMHECLINECEVGRWDVDGKSANGCEYVCNFISDDEDCDGVVDENCSGAVDEGCSCVNGQTKKIGDNQNGECKLCTQTCNNGVWSDCVGGQEPVPELCNGLDDDCDTVVDNGFNLMSDPDNCGACGNVCAFDHGVASCVQGVCTLAGCDQFYYDNTPANGCETACMVLGNEVCNEVDDDCNGIVDDGFDLMTDVLNCGSCGHVCILYGAEPGCENSKCMIGDCEVGFWDIDGVLENGCEYKCDPLGQEVCDDAKVDENCDGSQNEGCQCAGVEELETGTDEGLCNEWIQTCNNGVWGAKAGGVDPVPEICDGFDNDCDEEIDEDFDFLTNVDHCGECGNACSFDHATSACVLGECQITVCDDFYFDIDPQMDGCEYGPCVAQGQEQCDGFDNDCDGVVDNGFDFETDVTHCGDCETNCFLLEHVETATCAAGACAIQSCDPSFYDHDGDASNGCEYECAFKVPTVEVCGDALDNDCDGNLDNGCPDTLISCDFACPAGFVPVVWWGGNPAYSWTGETSDDTWEGSVPQACERGENPANQPGSAWIDVNCYDEVANVYQWAVDVVATCYYTDGPLVLEFDVRTGVIDPGGEGEVEFYGICE